MTEIWERGGPLFVPKQVWVDSPPDGCTDLPPGAAEQDTGRRTLKRWNWNECTGSKVPLRSGFPSDCRPACPAHRSAHAGPATASGQNGKRECPQENWYPREYRKDLRDGSRENASHGEDTTGTAPYRFPRR